METKFYLVRRDKGCSPISYGGVTPKNQGFFYIPIYCVFIIIMVFIYRYYGIYFLFMADFIFVGVRFRMLSVELHTCEHYMISGSVRVNFRVVSFPFIFVYAN